MFLVELNWFIQSISQNTRRVQSPKNTKFLELPSSGWHYYDNIDGHDNSSLYLTGRYNIHTIHKIDIYNAISTQYNTIKFSEGELIYPNKVGVSVNTSLPVLLQYSGTYAKMPELSRNRKPVWRHQNSAISIYLFYAGKFISPNCKYNFII